MRNVLVVHHDADLYGSDKSLLRTVRALKANGFWPIVALPHMGPLVALLRADGAEVHIGPVGKLTRQLMKPLALPSVARDMLASIRFISSVVAGRPITLAYSNSVAALGGAFWAMLHRVPRLWHVREIVVTPRVAVRGFPWMLKLLGGWCVCNSNATRRWIVDVCPSLEKRSSVIWNGLEGVPTPPAQPVAAFRAKLGIAPSDVVVTLVGRINRWKGQGVFIDAAVRLKQHAANGVRFLIVGDVADGQNHFRETMLETIRREGLEQLVVWHPFTPEIDVVWAASDIGVVPSTEPEPFGRVAIEAMAHGLPVIATAHGGLAEIVMPEVTGILVAPGSVQELADAIGRLIQSPALRQSLGNAGRQRQLDHFSQLEHDRKLMALMTQLSGGADSLLTPAIL